MLQRDKTEREFLLRRELAIRKSKENFWIFCKTLEPDFYKNDRQYLRTMCDTLQALYEGTLEKNGRIYKKLIMNIPPRHGKSRTMVNFSKWILGKSQENRIIECSYSDDAAWEFSRYTRDGISQVKNFDWEVVYSDIFPESKLKYGDSGVSKWALEGQFFNYLGAGIGGAITGKGCNVSIVDDPVKSAEIAFNEISLQKIWGWYTGTFLSRIEEGGIQIVNMTRWSTADLCGRLLQEEPDKWYVLFSEAFDGEKMLCDELLSRQSYEEKKAVMDIAIHQANYHQRPVDIKGRLYSELKTYIDLPMDSMGNLLADRIWCRVDTADEGNDFLCAIAGVEFKRQFYVTDVYYTQAPQEITEPETAAFLIRNRIKEARIESNNGGRAFARNVERILTEKGDRSVGISWFPQTKNKLTRILTNASNVQNNIYFPINWKTRFPAFYEAVTSFQREGKNKHDDAQDTLTGIVEDMQGGGTMDINFYNQY